MNINKTDLSYSFGKMPLLTCKIKDSETKSSVDATLYEMNPKNTSDLNDVMRSKNTTSIKFDFFDAYKNGDNYKTYYVLQNDKTGEVISCAQTEHRYKQSDAENEGFYTLIEDMGQNEKYINPAETLLSFIVKNAQERCDSFVYAAFSTDKIPSLQRAKFSQDKSGTYYIPEKRYNTLINQAEEHSQISYVV